MSIFDDLLRSDNRVRDLLVRRGALTHEEIAKQAKSLPDCASNAQHVSAYEEPGTTAGINGPTFVAG